MNQTWYIIINPRSGSGKTMSEWMPAERLLQRCGLKFKSVYTEYKGHAVALAKQAAADGYRRILAVGGDGTLHEIYRGIMLFCDAEKVSPSSFYMGVAPIGSGNDWIKMMGVPRDPQEVIRLMDRESFGRMDVVRMYHGEGEVSYMANVGGTGFDSHVCDRVNWQKEMSKRHSMIYLRGLKYTVLHLKPIRVQVIADGKQIFCGPCLSIAMGNGKYSGGGMCQVPGARINDGMLDAMIVPNLPLITIFKEMPKLLSETLDQSRNVIFTRCKELQILPLDNLSEDIFEVDGEIEGKLPLTVRVGEEQINALRG